MSTTLPAIPAHSRALFESDAAYWKACVLFWGDNAIYEGLGDVMAKYKNLYELLDVTVSKDTAVPGPWNKKIFRTKADHISALWEFEKARAIIAAIGDPRARRNARALALGIPRA